jgi:endoglycosylceramidase
MTAAITVAVGCLALATAGSASAASAAPTLAALHAIKGAGARIEDAGGRQVLLRGVDVDALGQYFQQYSQWPATMPLTATDYKEMAGLGFNVQRLVLSWSQLEPSRGEFNQAYVARIRQAVDWAAADGIYTVLDMHQDAYGIGVASSAQTDCPPGYYANVGYDGAPEWATFTNGQSTCGLYSMGQRSAAEATAWQNFWTNDDGIEQELAGTWGELAAAFASDPAVVGYDLLNEPAPGNTVNQQTAMGTYYSMALNAIRAGEASVSGGFSHIAFFEPGGQWSKNSSGTLPEGGTYTSDPNIVFAPHLYASSIGAGGIDQGYASAASAAAQFGTTVFAGEYGWYASPITTDTADIVNFTADQDKYLYSGAWWMWKQACGSPNTVNYFGQMVPTVTNSLYEVPCTQAALTDTALPTVSQMSQYIPPVLSEYVGRATVHAAPGQITALTSNPATPSFAVSGSTASAPASDCQLEVWIPGAGQPRFAATGVKDVVSTRVRGGWDVSGCASGTYSLTLTGRNAVGEGCAQAISVKPRGADRLIVAVSAKSESPCAATATLSARGRRSVKLALTLAPGTHRLLTLAKRLRPALKARRLKLTATVTDVDNNSYSVKAEL